MNLGQPPGQVASGVASHDARLADRKRSAPCLDHAVAGGVHARIDAQGIQIPMPRCKVDQTIADGGRDAYYRGPIAQAIVALLERTKLLEARITACQNEARELLAKRKNLLEGDELILSGLDAISSLIKLLNKSA